MSIYLAIFGKPRYMGLFNLTEPPRETLLVAETTGNGAGHACGPLSPDQGNLQTPAAKTFQTDR